MNCGEYDYGANVEIGYFDQMQQNLDLSKTALDEVWDTFPNMTQTEVRSALASFLFKGDEVFKPLSKMSGGERARVSLKLMLKGSNFCSSMSRQTTLTHRHGKSLKNFA